MANVDLVDADRTSLLVLAGAVEAISTRELHCNIDDLLSRDPEYYNVLGMLIAHLGVLRHWSFLVRGFLAERSQLHGIPAGEFPERMHRIMGSMLVFGRYLHELHHTIEALFVEFIDTSVTFGWEHYIYQIL